LGVWCDMVFNPTFINISVISWSLVLLVEETRVPGENHRPVASHWQTLSHKCCIEYTSLSIRFRNGTCIIILDKKYNIANSSCHFGSYGSIWTGPSPTKYYMDLRSFGPYNHIIFFGVNILYIWLSQTRTSQFLL
jgi:hypothetical protein